MYGTLVDIVTKFVDVGNFVTIDLNLKVVLRVWEHYRI